MSSTGERDDKFGLETQAILARVGAVRKGYAVSDYSKGMIITALGVLLVVPDSLFVRLIDGDPMVTAFWRALSSGSLVAVVVLATAGTKGFSDVIKVGPPAFIYMVLIASTTPGFVLAISNTSVANAVFIFASMPVFSALFGWIFLRERIGRRMVLTMIVVFIGLAIIAQGSGENEQAHWVGDAWALYVTIAYAGALTAVRRAKDVPMIPAVPLGYLGAALVIWMFKDPFDALSTTWMLYLAHGFFIGAATVFLTLGPRYISATEVALLILLESVLAPILVWFVLGEDPGKLALLGGAVVIGALLVSTVIAMRRAR